MPGSEVHLIGEAEFGGGHAEPAGLRRLAENLVSARILQFERQFARGDSFVAGAIERQRANVYGLPWLVDRLLRG